MLCHAVPNGSMPWAQAAGEAARDLPRNVRGFPGAWKRVSPCSETMVGHHGLMLPVSLWLLLVLLRDVHLFPLTHVFSCVFF